MKETIDYYHVTTKEDWENSIQMQGLEPRIGERSTEFGEETKRIYLFSSLEAYEDAMLQWMGELFEIECEEEHCQHEQEDGECVQPLVLVKVSLPLQEFERFTESEVDYEIAVTKPIKKDYLSLVEYI